MTTIRITPRRRTLHTLVLLCVMVSLLLGFMVPHDNHAATPLAAVSLSPLFLFGTAIDQGQSSPMVSVSEDIPSPAPLRPSLFRIPPPYLSL